MPTYEYSVQPATAGLATEKYVDDRERAYSVESASVSWNDVTAPGTYGKLMHGSVNPNGPGDAYYYYVTNYIYGGTANQDLSGAHTQNMTQVAVPYTGEVPVFRSRYTSVWSSWSKIATQSYVNAAMPIGSIVAYGGSAAPTGWHICDGTAHGSTALQTVLGSANAPDLRGRFVLAVSGTYARNSTGGSATHTLTEAEMPSHFHTNSPTTQLQGTDDLNYTSLISRGDAGVATQSVWNTSNTGGGGAHNNMPPYYALIYIIRKA
jgi:microcystin-dependent protein